MGKPSGVGLVVAVAGLLCVAPFCANGQAGATKPAGRSHASKPAPIVKPAAIAPVAEPVASGPRRIAANGFEYDIGRAPDWVLPLAPGGAPAGASNQDRRYITIDDQVLIDGPSATTYRRVVMVASSPNGLNDVGRHAIDFSPEYQRLTVHAVRVKRAGQSTDRLDPKSITLLRREEGLEKSVYNGTVTASIVVEDVRVGDQVEYEWSVTGANPVFGGTYASVWWLQRAVPIDQLRVRVAVRNGAPLQWRATHTSLKPQQEKTALGDELVLTAENIGAGRWQDDQAPIWDIPFPMLHVSQHANWQAVNRWGETLFVLSDALPDEAKAVVDRIAQAHSAPRPRALAALRYAQNEIRYFSVSLGASSHRPADAGTVLSRRYGDCKDKSLLLVALLRGLGVEAYPALVNSGVGKGIADWQAGHHVFDHAIVMAVIDGERYWLDPTMAEQQGSLENQAFTTYGKALVLGEKSGDLVDVVPPKDYVAGLDTSLRIVAKQFGAPAMLEVVTHYRGHAAQWARHVIGKAPEDQAVRVLDETYLRVNPGARRVGDFGRRDDPTANRYSVSAKYELPNFFRYSERLTAVAMVGTTLTEMPTLRAPQSLDRVRALGFPQPWQESVRLTIELPHDVTIQSPAPMVNDLGPVTFRHSMRASPGQVQIDWQLETKADHLPAQRAKMFAERLAKARESLGSSLQVSILDPRAMEGLSRNLAQTYSDRNVQRMPIAEQMRVRQRIGHTVATAQIDSGRLSGEMLARAYLERSSMSSTLARFDDAIADLDKAAALLPGDAEISMRYGELALYKGRLDEAINRLDAVKGLGGPTRIEFARGQAHYFAGRYPEARAAFRLDFEAAPSQRRAFSLIWLGLATSRAGEPIGKTVAAADRSSVSPDWPKPILDHLFGDIDASALLAASRNSDRRTELMQLCEAYFFLGQAALARGDTSAARDYFQKSRDTDVRMYIEYVFSGLELGRLAGHPFGTVADSK